MAVHGTEPQTLALPLNDSPAGLAAWMLGRRRAWSDCDGDLDRSYSREFLATTLSIYWFTQTIGTSMRFYYENFRTPWQPRHDRKPKVEVPTAFAQFPRDVMPLPRAVLERHSNLARWTLMERGGHFAPSEAPDLLVADVRAFFRDLPLAAGRQRRAPRGEPAPHVGSQSTRAWTGGSTAAAAPGRRIVEAASESRMSSADERGAEHDHRAGEEREVEAAEAPRRLRPRLPPTRIVKRAGRLDQDGGEDADPERGGDLALGRVDRGRPAGVRRSDVGVGRGLERHERERHADAPRRT